MKVLKALNSLVTALITLTHFKKKQKWNWTEISVELIKLRTKVDAIGKAIDEICEYSYKFILL